MLSTPHSSKQLIRDKIVKEIKTDSNINTFSNAAQKLMSLVTEEVELIEIAEVVKLESGLTSKVLRLSNSAAFGGASIKTVEDALFRLGMSEVRKMAMFVGVMDRVSHLRVKVDWNMYWLHSLLTARVTEALANAYRFPTGGEYLAGLLHDIGKLYLEHYFPRDFESVLLRSMERGGGMFVAESQLLDVTHSEVGALLCERWNLDKEIIRSIRYHHDPNSSLNVDPDNPTEQYLLATCICVADSLANISKINMVGAKKYGAIDVETLPEWILLQEFPTRTSLDLDLALEIQKAEETIAVFNTTPAPVASK